MLFTMESPRRSSVNSSDENSDYEGIVSEKCEVNNCNHIVNSQSISGSFDSLQDECDNNCSISHRKYVRSKSLSAFQIDKYSAREIRLMRERLLRTQKHPTPSHYRNFTRTQKMTLASLVIVDFISFCSMSIMAPFFPREAATKGMSGGLTGFIFSYYALVMFLSSPIFGKILPRVGVKFLFMSGMFVAACCSVLFGLLCYIDSLELFTLFCILVRGMEALGASAYSTASYVYVVEVFPDNIGSVLGLLETFVGLGMSIGPAIGGLLYSVGGFSVPFYTMGVIMLIIFPINICLLPSGETFRLGNKTGSLLEMLKLPSVVMVSLVIIVASNTWAFLDPTLEPHLRQFNMSAEQVGLIFLMFSAMYGIFSPLWGIMADKCKHHWFMMISGLVFNGISLLFLGPSPFLPFLGSYVWLNLVSLSVLGISVALVLLPTFQGLLESAIEGGCESQLGTYSMVAGTWSCMYSLGEVIGPSLGGFLLEKYGFPICSTVMALISLILAGITAAFCMVKSVPKVEVNNVETRNVETRPLLSPRRVTVAGSGAAQNV